MNRILLYPLTIIVLANMFSIADAQIHPKEALGSKIFDAFRHNKFSDFYLRSIFALEEDQFRDFLFGIENFELRQNLNQFYTLEYPSSAQTAHEKWKVAFAYTWRDQWRHIAHHSPRMIQRDAFDPILREAKEVGIQWDTTRLIGIEAILHVNWKIIDLKLSATA